MSSPLTALSRVRQEIQLQACCVAGRQGGFVLGLALPEDDRFYDDKADILELAGLAEAASFLLRVDAEPPAQLLAFLRLLNLSGAAARRPSAACRARLAARYTWCCRPHTRRRSVEARHVCVVVLVALCGTLHAGITVYPVGAVAACTGPDAFLLEPLFRNDAWGHMCAPVSEGNERAVYLSMQDGCKAALQVRIPQGRTPFGGGVAAAHAEDGCRVALQAHHLPRELDWGLAAWSATDIAVWMR